MTARLSRFVQLLQLATARTTTLPVKISSRCRMEHHMQRVIVLFAISAFTPTRVTASIQRPLPLFEQTMISAIGAHDEISRPVVRAHVTEVVNLFLASQKSAENAFNHKNVLRNSTASTCARVIGDVLSNIIVSVSPDAAPPTGMEFTESSLKGRRMRSDRVADAKKQRLTFSFDSPTSVLRPLAKRCRESATTLTKTRRIYQSRAPIACADSALNLTHTGGIRG